MIAWNEKVKPTIASRPIRFINNNRNNLESNVPTIIPIPKAPTPRIKYSKINTRDIHILDKPIN